MQLLVLGSASSQGIPHPFCSCSLCRKARGRDWRLRSAYLVKLNSGENILLDTGPDFREQQVHFRFDFRYLFLSHRHRDHTQGLEEMRISLGANVGRRRPRQKKRVFLLGKKLESWLLSTNHDVRWEESTQQAYQQLLSRKYFRRLILSPFKRLKICDGVWITYIHGYHEKIYCGGLVVHEGKKTLVYLADIGYLNTKLFEYLKKISPDLVIAHSPFFGQPSGDKDPKKHLKIEDIVGIPGKKILVSHFSHRVRLSHKRLVQKAKKSNPRLIIAYDGQEIKI